MSDLKILIRKKAITRRLKRLSNLSNDLIYLNIPSENIDLVNYLLTEIDGEEWTKSIEETDSLVLPKKAVK